MTDFRPTRFEILPLITKNLLIINVLVFIAQLTFDGTQSGSNDLLEVNINGHLINQFALHSLDSSLFRPWQLITHMFMHGSLLHILFNMFALWTFGSILEGIWGPKRFLIFYLVCGLGAACMLLGSLFWQNHEMIADLNIYKLHPSREVFAHFVDRYNLKDWQFESGMSVEKMLDIWGVDANNPAFPDAAFNVMSTYIKDSFNGPNLGASGAVFGCLAAFAYLFPNTPLYLMFIPIPIKAKWAILGYAAVEFILELSHIKGDNVAHVAHLGGALVGFLLVFFWNKTNRKTFY